MGAERYALPCGVTGGLGAFPGGMYRVPANPRHAPKPQTQIANRASIGPVAMTASELGLWLSALAIPCTALGGWLRWYLVRLDKSGDQRNAAAAKVQKALEDAIELRFAAQDARMQDMAKGFAEQQQTIKNLREMLGVYIRHTNKLEVMLAAEGLPIPPIEIPPGTGHLL